ncbi:hypothetical protein BJF93_15335 [Xaviernesmea oryzae]|uniref:Ribosome maturation factor RimP n=1 Tax=Xaviernesmea oryzae TaxID=464029 RepID=A0A1Q9AXY6_9HYPH|nr:hypothetical protein [Xaviernesmea oryzae]OLP60328.1 hypothetical protein BJF93_15335 [Xaviernesmea oryzae]SEK23085.1 hypothetical protein SAMN04487976_101151 [Xaviernesmea oryzae]
MHRKIDFNKLEKLIQAALSEGFADVEILRVHVVDDVEVEGEDILRVEVVFEGRARDIPSSFLTRAIRKVRPALSSVDISAFPMMSFISAADAKIAART